MQIDFTETPEISYKTRVSNILYSQAMLQPDEINYLIDGMLAEHAHELAEQIRETANRREEILGKRLEDSAIERAVANRIDPKVGKP